MKALGPGEHLDALALLEPVARLLPDDARIVFRALLGDGSGGNPQLLDLDPAGALITGGVVEPEKLTRAFDVVVVQMGEADHIQVVAVGVVEFAAKLIGEVIRLS